MNEMGSPNILVIVMDTARFDTVRRGISEGILSNVRDLSTDATVFTECHANGPWTLPSHGSLFTGQYPSDHGAHAGTKHFDPSVPTVAQRLKERGYRTCAYSNNTWISPEFGFDRGFDDFMLRWELVEGGKDPSGLAKAGSMRDRLRVIHKLITPDLPNTILNLLYATYLYYTDTEDDGARCATDRIIKWIRRNDDRPFFLFANYTEPHLRYDPPAGYRYRHLPDELSRSDLDEVPQDPWGYITGTVDMTDRDFQALSSLYLSELEYLDDQLGRLFDALDDRGILDETAVFILGDHGENIGDHGLMDHQYCVRESLTHVPLICRYPEVFSGRERDGLIELRDLYPTILSIAGDRSGAKPSSVSRLDLSEFDQPGFGREYSISEYLEPQPSMQALRKKVGTAGSARQYDHALRCLRTDEWTYIENSDGGEELYYRAADPKETSDVSESNPEKVAELRELLLEDQGELVRNPGERRMISGRTRRRLEDMGYIQ